MTDYSFIARRHFVGQSPRGINSGDCWKWAMFAYEYGDTKLWWSKHHVFVCGVSSGLFYDAEAPLGVSDYDQLPYLLRRPWTTDEGGFEPHPGPLWMLHIRPEFELYHRLVVVPQVREYKPTVERAAASA